MCQFLTPTLTGCKSSQQTHLDTVGNITSNDNGKECLIVTLALLPDHLSLDSAPNLGPLISRWEISKFENC
jgi:hypothetical protein